MFDIELTNRCNADCSFCPRDETPHQGLMDGRTFALALDRIVEHRRHEIATTGRSDHGVSFCGMGDVLVHPRAAACVAAVRRRGLWCQLNTNGALLRPALAEELLAAGLCEIRLNVGAVGERYDELYGLPFERTERNVANLLSVADGRCRVIVVLAGAPDDADRLDAAEAHWRALGATMFHRPAFTNRGGALDGDQLAIGSPRARRVADELLGPIGERPRCATPFVFMFIGYDGRYYLCSSDWRRQAPCGDVASTSIREAAELRLAHLAVRTAPCSGCNFDPGNQVEVAWRTSGTEAARERAATLHGQWAAVEARLADMEITSPPAGVVGGRRDS